MPGAIHERWAAEVAKFLSHLAQERDVAAATQNQALNALVFLYGVVMQKPGIGVRSPLDD